MIKENELRIGNYFHYAKNDILGAVYEITFDRDMGYKVSKIPLNSIRPIPLTPEIFERCGFEQTEYMVFKTQYHTICLYSDGYAFFNGENKIGVGFRYLHTFQNVFFAYTGEELEIKEIE